MSEFCFDFKRYFEDPSRLLQGEKKQQIVDKSPCAQSANRSCQPCALPDVNDRPTAEGNSQQATSCQPHVYINYKYVYKQTFIFLGRHLIYCQKDKQNYLHISANGICVSNAIRYCEKSTYLQLYQVDLCLRTINKCKSGRLTRVYIFSLRVHKTYLLNLTSYN